MSSEGYPPFKTGLVILTLESNSKLTIRNQTSSSTYVDLQTDIESDEIIVNAAITIKKLE